MNSKHRFGIKIDLNLISNFTSPKLYYFEKVM